MTDSQNTVQCASRLRKQMMLLVRRMRRETRPLEMPLSQLLLLSRIEQLGENATPTALAESEGLRPQNLSALLRKIEQQGYVEREEDAYDKRKYRIKLSPGGSHVLEMNRSDRDTWLAQAMRASLNQDEIAILREAGILLERLASYSIAANDTGRGHG